MRALFVACLLVTVAFLPGAVADDSAPPCTVEYSKTEPRQAELDCSRLGPSCDVDLDRIPVVLCYG